MRGGRVFREHAKIDHELRELRSHLGRQRGALNGAGGERIFENRVSGAATADAAAMSHLWLRNITPNLADYGTCAEVAMTYAPIWESSHRNWLVVKVGCPTKIVDADGKTIGWHMPECQGTLPGTTYPLRCRFDPSET